MNETELAFDFGEPSGRHSRVIDLEVEFRGDKNDQLPETGEQRAQKASHMDLYLKAERIAAEAKQKIFSVLETDILLASQGLTSVLSQILRHHIIVSMNYHPLPRLHRGDSNHFRTRSIKLAEEIFLDEVREWHDQEIKNLLKF